jgi:ornithine--oxo-acid transaminase
LQGLFSRGWIIRGFAALCQSLRSPPAKLQAHSWANDRTMQDLIALEERFGTRNYSPLPVVLTRGKGCRLWDTQGREYLDFMSAYSAVSHGHGHPRLLAALAHQAERLAITSRAFHSDQLGAFLQRACELTGMDRALPLNTGVEAVEAALKLARRWGYRVKGIEKDQAEIIACRGNFHGRTIGAIALSDEPAYRRDFGPYPAGVRLVDYGDASALDAAITDSTAAFIVEPIQGEGGIVVPPEGYLAACADICRRRRVLLIADEIQTGLGRTGLLLACEHEGVKPDLLLLGKALGGGLYPVSLVLGDTEVMALLEPGSHGSTFGGNPLAAAVGRAALEVLIDEELIENSARMGELLRTGLARIRHPAIKDIRGRGLFIGLELDAAQTRGRAVSEALLERGILARETHGTVLRLAPPLIIGPPEIEQLLSTLPEVLEATSAMQRGAAAGHHETARPA